MNCPNCGNEINDNQKFCPNCGSKIEIETETSSNNQETKTTGFVVSDNLATKIIMIFVGIIFIAGIIFGVIEHNQYIEYIKPLELSEDIGDLGKIDIKVVYEPNQKRALISFYCNEIIAQDWMRDYIEDLEEKYPNGNYAILMIKSENGNKDLNLECLNYELKTQKPLVFKFAIENLEPQDFALTKEFILKAKKTKNIHIKKLVIFSNNKAEQTKAKEKWLKEKEQQKADEETMELAQTWAFQDGGGGIETPIDFNPRKCAFKVKGICFGRPFIARAMSYEDCKEYQSKTGVKSCKESRDLYATTALVCGGVKNMPTIDELTVLAHDMYNDNAINNEKRADGCTGGGGNYQHCNSYGRQRDNNKDYIEYFRNLYWKNPTFVDAEQEQARINLEFAIMSNLEVEKNYRDSIYARIFEGRNAALGYVHRYQEIELSNNPYIKRLYTFPIASICVDRSASKPLKTKYPITTKTYNKEVENDLF